MIYSLEMALKYPLMRVNLIEESDTILIEGKMFVNDRDFSIALKQKTLIDGDQKYELARLDNASESTIFKIKEILNSDHSLNLVEALDKIRDRLESEYPVTALENYCDIYRKVLHEYSEFTKFFWNLKTCKLKEDLTKIFVSILDSKLREHSAEISVDYSNKSADIFRISLFDLPSKTQDHFKVSENLTSLFDQFLAQVELLQPYFDLMEEFDKSATILDPDAPKRRDSYRRIWLSENCSVIITVDPYNIFQRPNVKFLGPERLVDTYSANLNKNLCNWVYQENIFQEVLALLGLDHFPMKEMETKQVNLLVEYGECSICFSLRLNEKLPEIICANKCCEKFYHNECLYNWLASLNAKRVFNNVTGNCPNCEKTISCPVLD